MDDDLNSPMVISALFDWVRVRSTSWPTASRTITAADLAALTATVRRYAFDILGLRDEKAARTASGRDYVTPLVEMLLGRTPESPRREADPGRLRPHPRRARRRRHPRQGPQGRQGLGAGIKRLLVWGIRTRS